MKILKPIQNTLFKRVMFTKFNGFMFPRISMFNVPAVSFKKLMIDIPFIGTIEIAFQK